MKKEKKKKGTSESCQSNISQVEKSDMIRA